MHLPLSVLDLVPVVGTPGESAGSSKALRNSLELVQHADRLGYTRYWFAEHHNMPTIASTTPEIMIAMAGERTSRIRVGSGGVMLPNHSALQVAETFKMLEALHPGRVDLGIGRAPGTDMATALALRGSREALSANDFPAQLVDLLEYGGRGAPSRQAARAAQTGSVAAMPPDVILPPIWLLGSSDFSAELAALLGTGFGFAAHFSEYPPEGPMLAYREQFSPSQDLAQPHAILTLSVICAPTQEEAERLVSSLLVAFARLRTGQTSLLLPPEEAMTYRFSAMEAAVVDSIRGRHLVGTPASVKAQIEALVERTRADEVMISTFIYGHEERLRSYELLAEAFGL
ncbi:MAG: luciferase-like protein [Chthonomonadales bacterium]|nr:luciferase-like protein [Chthonomonadales bacterium]